MEKKQKQLNWATISLIAFNLVWGLGNVVNNYAQQGISVISSWVLILVIYLIPYALIVGQLGATFKKHEGGVTEWISRTSTKRLAFFAAWTFWVTQIPYLAQKAQAILIALGWVVQGNGDFLTSLSTPALVGFELLAFLFLLYLSTKGLKALKYLGTIAGSAMLVMSLLFIALALALPAIKPDLQLATSNMNQPTTYIPNFDFSYLTMIALLVFSVGGAETMSPYVNQSKNPAKEFPKGMIAMVVMVGICAIFGSLGMGMLFDSNNIPADLMRNGAYQAFDLLGQHWGVGRILVFVYAVTQFLGQSSVLALNVDTHMQLFLGSENEEFIPSWLRKRNHKGTLVNGYLLTGILVSVLIALPLLGLKQIDGIVHWLTNLNAIVLPMSYLWVFLAFILLYREWDKYKNADYVFVKNRRLGYIVGGWGFGFTAFACIMGMFPQVDMASQPTEWCFAFLTNVLTPVVLLAMGMVLPWIARREKTQTRHHFHGHDNHHGLAH